MTRTIVTYLLLFALPFYFGCSSLAPIQKESWSKITEDENQTDEVHILTKDYNIYHLYWGSITVKNDTLSGSGYRKSNYGDIPFEGSIALGDISEIQIEHFDLTVTIILITGIVVIVGSFFLLLASDSMKGVGSGIKFSNNRN